MVVQESAITSASKDNQGIETLFHYWKLTLELFALFHIFH